LIFEGEHWTRALSAACSLTPTHREAHVRGTSAGGFTACANIRGIDQIVGVGPKAIVT
jgi:predicted rRNA methylase YqxC with S4 and FtsJ domains